MVVLTLTKESMRLEVTIRSWFHAEIGTFFWKWFKVAISNLNYFLVSCLFRQG